MVLGSLAEWAALIHFNLIAPGWASWRGGIIAAVAYIFIVYVSAKKGDSRLLYVVLIGMAAPWIYGVVAFVGYSFTVWHIPEFRRFDFSLFGLIQLTFNVLGGIYASRKWLEN